MLKPVPFANSIALTTVLFYIALWLLGSVSPELAKMVESLGKSQLTTSSLVPQLVAAGVVTWVFGWLWASFYNKLNK